MSDKGKPKFNNKTNEILLHRRHGDIRLVSEVTGFSRDYVKKVIDPNDVRYNSTIIETMCNIINTRGQIIDKNLKVECA